MRPIDETGLDQAYIAQINLLFKNLISNIIDHGCSDDEARKRLRNGIDVAERAYHMMEEELNDAAGED